MARLPTPGSDTGTWGTILNEYLSQVHNADGTLKNDVVTAAALADDAVSTAALNTTNNPSSGQVLSFNGTNLTWIVPPSAPVTSVNGQTGAVVLTKSDVGLGNVDNTADINKPISTATQTALDAKIDEATLTTKGDIYVATGAGAVTRLGVGSNGTVLTADSAQATGLIWSAPAEQTISVAAKSASYTITNSDDVVKATTSGIVITLHNATTATSKRYTIQNASSGNISFATTASQTVNGSTTGTIIPGQSLDVVGDGANWIIV